MPSVVLMPLVLSPLVYLAGRWAAPTARHLTLAAFVGMWLFCALAAHELNAAGAGFLAYRQGMIAFYFDGLSLLITALTLLLATLVAIFSGPEMRHEEGEEKYYALLVLMAGAVIGLVAAGDLFNLWLWFEMLAISSYLLVAFYREQHAVLAACAKYLFQTAIASSVILFGFALIFAQTGHLDLVSIRVPVTPLMIIAGTFAILGFGTKIALVPSYTWLPDAYAQAPTGVSTLLSGVVTLTGLIALMRVLGLLTGLAFSWGTILITVGALNVVLGNLIALSQTEVKRIFAYSSISHIGLIAMAVGVGICAGQYSGYYSGMLHLAVHGLMKALAFLCAGVVIYSRRVSPSPLRVSDLRGLVWHDPVTAIALITACLSLAGIPPLAGFTSKLLMLSAGLEAGSTSATLLMVFVGLNSVLSLAYYLLLINTVFQPAPQPAPCRVPFAMRLPVILLTVAIWVLGLAPGLLNGLIAPAGDALIRLMGG